MDNNTNSINSAVFEDAFNMLAGDKIGEGSSREVFECKIRPDLVVKVEASGVLRDFSNVMEWQFHDWHRDCEDVIKWLAPIEFVSPDARILLMKKATIATSKDQLPTKIPGFLTDRKPENFGFIDGQCVCVDYQFTVQNPSTRLTKANW